MLLTRDQRLVWHWLGMGYGVEDIGVMSGHVTEDEARAIVAGFRADGLLAAIYKRATTDA